MLKPKDTLVVTFTLFSLFFGAGNLILPPLLGFKSGNYWWLVVLGFCISAVIIPICGIIAHARLQGTMLDFANKISPTFSSIYCYLVYAISISLPGPRTAAVTHEMAIAPLFNTSSWLTSTIYFALVLVFVLNRSKVLSLIGKILTPNIIIILFVIIGITVYTADFTFGTTVFESPFTTAILEGYQTFDAIGAIVVGGVIVISVNLKYTSVSYIDKKKLIIKSAWIAGAGLAFIYLGLILVGALMHSEFPADSSRTDLLQGISLITLGNTGNFLLRVLISLACFTTAVGIVAGTSDFIKHRFKNSESAFKITAIIGCILGVVMGQLNVGYIIQIALPALMFIYPVTIVLIILNILPEKYSTATLFKLVIATTMLFSIPDFLNSVGYPISTTWLPLAKFQLGWVIPTCVVLIATLIYKSTKPILQV